MINILLTGAKGFIGTNIINQLQDKYRIFTIEEEDICSRNLKKYFKGIDYVIHLAAISGIDYCEHNPELATKVNVLGTENILSFSYDNGIRKVIFLSSSAVYHSKGVYAKTKINAEKMCKYYSDNLGLQTIILRLSNVYDLNMGYGVADKFYKDNKLGLPLNIYGSGEDSYDFIHVFDVISLIEKIIDQDGDHYADIFDVGSGYKYSINQIANAISNKIIYHDKNINSYIFDLNILNTEQAFSWKADKDIIKILTDNIS